MLKKGLSETCGECVSMLRAVGIACGACAARDYWAYKIEFAIGKKMRENPLRVIALCENGMVADQQHQPFERMPHNAKNATG
jgi:hypothetical protein